jgi:hypothetical protein
MIYNVILVDTKTAKEEFSYVTEVLPRTGEDVIYTDHIAKSVTMYTVKHVVHKVARYLDEPNDNNSECIGSMSYTLYVEKI